MVKMVQMESEDQLENLSVNHFTLHWFLTAVTHRDQSVQLDHLVLPEHPVYL